MKNDNITALNPLPLSLVGFLKTSIVMDPQEFRQWVPVMEEAQSNPWVWMIIGFVIMVAPLVWYFLNKK